MRRFLRPSLGWTSEGNSLPQKSLFRDGKIGFRMISVVAAGTRIVTVYAHSDLMFLPQ